MSNAIVQVGPSVKLDSGKQLVHAVLGGTLGKEEITLIKAWADGLKDTIKSTAAGANGSVCVLIDIREMETYNDPMIITVLTDLMKSDNSYVYRTATFGGTILHEMIEQVIRTMADRTNLKNFKTEDEAMQWLTQ